MHAGRRHLVVEVATRTSETLLLRSAKPWRLSMRRLTLCLGLVPALTAARRGRRSGAGCMAIGAGKPTSSCSAHAVGDCQYGVSNGFVCTDRVAVLLCCCAGVENEHKDEEILIEPRTRLIADFYLNETSS